MAWFRKCELRFRALFHKEEFDARMDNEIRSHIEMQTQENIDAGMKPEEARFAALRQFGWVETIKDTCRDQHGMGWIESFGRDVRYGARVLLKNPVFTVVAVLTLAFGIGANTAIFSFVNAILLRPLPYREPERLTMLFENQPSKGLSRFNPGAPVLREWRKQCTAFDGIAAARTFGDLTLTGDTQPEVFRSSAVSANFFPLLGIQPILGRGFVPEEETPGKDDVVILSYELWQRRFGGDRNVIGQNLTLNMRSYRVVGVMPRLTAGPEGRRDLWTPLAFAPYEITERHSHSFLVLGRLKSGVTLQQARQEMDLIGHRLAETDPDNRGWGAEVYPLHEIVVGNTRRLLLVLLSAVGLVLLIGCANIASLLLARSAARTQEFAIRAALGASRGDMLRQLLTESCILAGLGGIFGVLLAALGLNTLVRLSPSDFPRVNEGIPLDAATLGFTALVTLATGILFGLLPALQASDPALARDLTETARGSSAGPKRQLARGALVVAEVALSAILLTSAGLTIRSFEKLLGQSLGYRSERLITMRLTLPFQRYSQQDQRVRFYDSLLMTVTNLPGIESAGYAFGVPLTDINDSRSVLVRDQPPPPPGEMPTAGYAQVSSGYFAAMKTPFVQGRDFSERDNTHTRPVAIVDETFVRRFNLGDHVLGQRLDIGDGTQDAKIVGVVKPVRRVGVAEAPRGEVYRPYRQICWGVLTLVVRTSREPGEVTRAIRSELNRIDKDIPLQDVFTMSQLVSANIGQRRLSMLVLGCFAVGALLLSGLGLYGVLANIVTQRRREIGIRLALGAQQRDVLALVIGQGMRLTMLGMCLGLIGAFVFTRVLERLLYEIKPSDPLTFATVTAVLAGVALIACWLPAWRAAHVDPMVAWRHE